MPEHQVHDFSRLISASDDGRAVFGCAHRGAGLRGCAETEIRGRHQPSPYALRRAQRKTTRKTRGGS
jgi:hypothetical protein